MGSPVYRPALASRRPLVQFEGCDAASLRLDDAGNQVQPPICFIPGCLVFKLYLEEFPGYYKTADAGFVDSDGYLFIMARTDGIINVAGHRLSTGAMEEVIAGHKDVAECAVIGIADKLKGQMPVGFMIVNKGVNTSEADLEKEIVKLVRDKIGPVAAFKTALIVPRLPKTRSGKILRATMQKIADGEPWKMPATIDDPAILDEITESLNRRGLKSSS